MIRVLLVDDHAVVVEGLTTLLAGYDGIETVGHALGGAEAVESYDELRPDVTLMDLSMPEVDGVEAIARIRDLDPEARVLALTGFIEADLVTAALTAGAQGYLLKNVSGSELVDAIRTVASGRSILSPEALPHLTPTNRRRVGDDLTPRELDVLRYLVIGHSNKQIAAELGLTHGTVRIHVSNVLSKLKVGNRTSAAHVARQHHLVSSDPSTEEI